MRRLCCINSFGHSSERYSVSLGRDSEDVEEFVYETDLVLDARLTCEAMPSTDHTHHFKALDRSGRCPHRLKASCRANDSLECAMICFDDVVQVLRCPMFCIGRQLAFSL